MSANQNEQPAGAARRQRRNGKISKYYAVPCGRTVGIFTEYKGEGQCEASVSGYPGGKHKSFTTLAEAVEFMNRNKVAHNDISILLKETCYSNKDGPIQGVKSYSLHDHCTNMGIDVPPVFLPPQSAESKAPVVNIDGACLRNGYPDASGGIGIFWGPDSLDNIGCGTPDDGVVPTNNRAELYAAITAMQQAIKLGLDEVVLRSDSLILVDGMNENIHAWKSSGDLEFGKRPNTDLWLKLDDLATNHIKVQWRHVRGHSGDKGNDAADHLANNAAESNIRWEDVCRHRVQAPPESAANLPEKPTPPPTPPSHKSHDAPEDTDSTPNHVPAPLGQNLIDLSPGAATSCKSRLTQSSSPSAAGPISPRAMRAAGCAVNTEVSKALANISFQISDMKKIIRENDINLVNSLVTEKGESARKELAACNEKVDSQNKLISDLESKNKSTAQQIKDLEKQLTDSANEKKAATQDLVDAVKRLKSG